MGTFGAFAPAPVRVAFCSGQFARRSPALTHMRFLQTKGNDSRSQGSLSESAHEGRAPTAETDGNAPAAENSIGRIEKKLVRYKALITDLSQKIVHLEKKIQDVEREIRDVEKEIQKCSFDLEAANGAVFNTTDPNVEQRLLATISYVRETEMALRRKEEFLRQEMLRPAMKSREQAQRDLDQAQRDLDQAQTDLCEEEKRSAEEEKRRPWSLEESLDKVMRLCSSSTNYDKGDGFDISRAPILGDIQLEAYKEARGMVPDGEIALPGREQQLDYLLSCLKASCLLGGVGDTRADVPVVNQGPGFGKTSFLLLGAEAFHDEIMRQGRPPPIIAMLSYNGLMSKPINCTDLRLKYDQAVALRIFWGGLKCMGCTHVRDWEQLLDALGPAEHAAVVRKGLYDPDTAVSLLQLLYGEDRDVLVFADELIRGVEVCRESPGGTELASSIYSLMDGNMSNLPKRPRTHVVISAMSYERIDMAISQRIIRNLYMAPLSVTEGAYVAKMMMKNKGVVSGDQKDEDDLNSYASLISALSGGHIWALVRAVRELREPAAIKGKFLDLKDHTAVLDVFMRSNIVPATAASKDSVLLEDLLTLRTWTSPVDLVDMTVPTKSGVCSASDLIHRGEIAPAPFGDKMVLDVMPNWLLHRQKGTATSGSALQLLDKLLQVADGNASAYGEQVSAFFTAYTLCSQLSSTSTTRLDDILPTANDQLEQCTDVGWSFNSSCFDASKVDLQVVHGFNKRIKGEDGHEIKDPWKKLCQHFKSTMTQLTRSSDHWKARLVLAPPSCPAIDYLVHFYMDHKDGSKADIVFGVQVKTSFADADAATQIVSKMEGSSRFLAAEQLNLGVNIHLCYHVGNTFNKSELDAKPEGVEVVTGKSFMRHFLPSLARLLSIVKSSK